MAPRCLASPGRKVAGFNPNGVTKVMHITAETTMQPFGIWRKRMRSNKAENCNCLPGAEVRDNASFFGDTRKLPIKYALIGIPMLAAWWLS
jgi:hypothetical protein